MSDRIVCRKCEVVISEYGHNRTERPKPIFPRVPQVPEIQKDARVGRLYVIIME